MRIVDRLRSIREKHAGKIAGMTPAEIISESKKRKKIKPHLYEVNWNQEKSPLHSVAELRGKYCKDKGGKQ